MSLRKGFLGLCVFIFCFGMVCAKTVKVDCFKGKSINAVLNAHKNAEELIIEIDGTCKEDVIVRRDNVTLLGINLDVDGEPTDGIQGVSTDPAAPPNFGVALWIRDAANVTVKDLRIFGAARHGLRVTNSRPLIRVENSRLEGNALRGLSVLDARVMVLDTTLTGNVVGGAILFGAVAIFDNCIFDETGIAVTATEHSTAVLRDSTVERGAYRANRKSIIELDDTDQIVNPSENSFTGGSQLRADVPSNIQGPSIFTDFSTGFFEVDGARKATHDGSTMTCESGSDVFCDEPANNLTGGSTSIDCSSCTP